MKKGKNRGNKKKLRLRRVKQRDIGKEIARVKRNIFQPVRQEYITQRDMATSCIMQTRNDFNKLSIHHQYVTN